MKNRFRIRSFPPASFSEKQKINRLRILIGETPLTFAEWLRLDVCAAEDMICKLRSKLSIRRTRERKPLQS